MNGALCWLGRVARTLAAALGVAFVIAMVAFVVLAGNAHGQVPLSRLLDSNGLLRSCGPAAPPGPVPAPYPPALPQQLGGKCTSIVVEANAKGGAVGWWCARTEPDPAAIHLYAVTWDKLTAPMLIDFARLGLPGDNAELIRSMQSKYATLHVADMCDVWIGMRDRLNAIRPAALPPTPVLSPYVVTPAGTATVRPAYPVTAGKRSTTAGGTAVPGQPCDCAALQIIEFNIARYCAAPSITGITGPAVTSCTARPK